MKASTFFGLMGVTAGLMALSGKASAATLTWGNAVHATSYNSDGSLLEAGSDTEAAFFELGVFTGGFVPSLENIEQWGTNFVPLTPGGTPSPYAYDPATPYFTDAVAFGNGTGSTSASQVTNTDVAAGLQVYLWGYQTKTITDGEYTDWFLVTGNTSDTTPTTNNWVTPDVGNTTQANLNLTWDINTANTPIVGRIDDGTGAGLIESNATLGLDSIQFASVPEPSTWLSLLIGLSLACVRRRR